MAHLSLKSKTLISFSALFFFSFLFSVFSAELGDDDAAYLLKLRHALHPAPSDWFNNTDMCRWSGVVCSLDTNFNFSYVEVIDLHSKALAGTLPSNLRSLSRLKYLSLYNNSLSGSLPSLAGLKELQKVALDYNNFTIIPDDCFQDLTSLQELSVSYNTNLGSWTFPTALANSTQLISLTLTATNLMTFLPEIFHSFPNLQAVNLSNNNLGGVLPKSFAQSNIESLALNDQSFKLSGTIEVLSSMTKLTVVDLRGNCLEGPIPDLSNCANLHVLLVEDNRLTGVVPPSLMSLSQLATVSLGHNLLQGPVPVFKEKVNVSLGVNANNSFCLDHVAPCDQQVTTLLEIAAGFGYPYLLANSWRGNNPCQHWSFIECDGDEIRTVNLTNQNLTGTISPAFGNLTNLWNLYLGGNNLTGLIPESLATLSQLKILDVSNNSLSGHIPRFSSRVLLTTTGNVLLDLSQANAASPTAGIAGTLIIDKSKILHLYKKLSEFFNKK